MTTDQALALVFQFAQDQLNVLPAGAKTCALPALNEAHQVLTDALKRPVLQTPAN